MVSAETKPNSSSNFKLIDGRKLSYKERGVPKEKSNYRIIFIHGFDSSKERDFLAPQELMNTMGVYIVQFDRAGYGGSDPNLKRSLRSEASDIEELANHLELGSKFHIIGFSMGSYPTWSCIKHLSHRLAGVAFVVPIVNYQWPSLPESVLKDDERKKWYKRMTLVARYAPKLLHWWMIRKTSQSSSTDSTKPTYFTDKDLELLKNAPGFQFLTADKLKSRSVFNNLRSDFLVAFSKWDFDPLELSNPFPENDKRPVHIWHGCEDRFINLKLQRHVSERLPWIQYHEVHDGGHLLIYDTAVCEAILKSLLLGVDTPLYTPKFTS
ncbi:uncharacterized protein [Solanum tuberosum]|uniref:AB hydrolase-1 domain-containing protein n=2 Tax=Solanum tuberosum TaxID=4113 RepID=M1AUE8_SOLTU|nr:PREDICTED: uncharacterized protein LOC102587803 [Solanum tuberosum]XP_015160074.1 PREDICTED: uncharacterized protein LOC102587803 [Solanum tuberosum]